MQATAAGAAVGMTNALINEASITHTRFPTLDPIFQTIEFYNNNGQGPFDAITIALRGGTIGGSSGFSNGGTVSEPASITLLGIGIAGLFAALRRRQTH